MEDIIPLIPCQEVEIIEPSYIGETMRSTGIQKHAETCNCDDCRVYPDLDKQFKENKILCGLIHEAVKRLQMPPELIRGNGFEKLMGKLRSINLEKA